MAGEFHHDIRRYSVREGEANEGLAASVGANEFVFGFDFVVTDVVFVVCDGVGRVEAADFAEVFEAAGDAPDQGIPAETLTRPLPHHHSIHNVLLLGRCPTEVNTCRFYTLVPHQVCKKGNVIILLKKILCIAMAK